MNYQAIQPAIRPILKFGLLAPAIFAVTVVGGLARQPKIAADLDVSQPDKTVNVIVRFRHTPTEAHHLKIRQRGGQLQRTLPLIRGAHYSLPAGRLANLAKDPEVEYIAPDRPVKAFLDNTAAAVNAPVAWASSLDGTGIGIAIIDSGVSGNDDLKDPKGANRIVYNQSFTTGGAGDQYGHGGHVAGVAAGSGKRSTGNQYFRTFRGIAPNASIINLRVLDQNGAGTDSSVIAAIQTAINLKSKYNIRVINLSLGRSAQVSYTQDPLCQAVEAAWNAGIVVVVAAGNNGRDNSMNTSGYGTIAAPGNDPYVITVGAMKTMGTPSRTDDLIASYSSKGPTLFDHIVKPDLVAPGNRTVSLFVPGGQIEAQFKQNAITKSSYITNGGGGLSGDYFEMSGTSMATPVVSGAVALLLQQNPSLTPDQVKGRLMKTAYKNFPAFSIASDPVTGQTYQSEYDIFTVGAGYLDIAAALASTDLAIGPAQSPSVSVNTDGTVSLLTGPSLAWDASPLWSASVVWGTNVFAAGTDAVWGNSVVWGTSSMQGFSVIWGTSVVWGTGQAAAENLTMAASGED
jgi:serine protease AprX